MSAGTTKQNRADILLSGWLATATAMETVITKNKFTSL